MRTPNLLIAALAVAIAVSSSAAPRAHGDPIHQLVLVVFPFACEGARPSIATWATDGEWRTVGAARLATVERMRERIQRLPGHATLLLTPGVASQCRQLLTETAKQVLGPRFIEIPTHVLDFRSSEFWRDAGLSRLLVTDLRRLFLTRSTDFPAESLVYAAVAHSLTGFIRDVHRQRGFNLDDEALSLQVWADPFRAGIARIAPLLTDALGLSAPAETSLELSQPWPNSLKALGPHHSELIDGGLMLHAFELHDGRFAATVTEAAAFIGQPDRRLRIDPGRGSVSVIRHHTAYPPEEAKPSSMWLAGYGSSHIEGRLHGEFAFPVANPTITPDILVADHCPGATTFVACLDWIRTVIARVTP